MKMTKGQLLLMSQEGDKAKGKSKKGKKSGKKGMLFVLCQRDMVLSPVSRFDIQLHKE